MFLERMIRFCLLGLLLLGDVSGKRLEQRRKKVEIKYEYLPQVASLGEPPKQIFGKSWEFDPRREGGGGSDPVPTFFSKLTET